MGGRDAAPGLPWDGPETGGETLGAQVQGHRRRAGLSQEDAAARASISARALRDIERDRVNRPQAGTLQRLATALGLSGADVDRLLTAAHARPARNTGRLRFLILGPLVVQRDRTPLAVTSPMQRRLLGLLALKHPEPATQQEIAETLWPAGPPGSRQSLVHTYVSQVRQLLEPAAPRAGAKPAVARTPTGYLLEAAWSQRDLGHFDELLARAKRALAAADPVLAYESLTCALEWWRGPVLADADPALRNHPAAVAANEQRTEAVLLHADAALRLGRPEDAVRRLWEMVREEPLHEGLHARLVLTLASCGEQAAALKVFTRFRDRLDEELGIAPSEELREAHLRVLRQQLPRARRTGTDEPWTPAAPGPAPAVRPAQLPAEAGAYVGRRRQLRELDGLVATNPAVRQKVVAVVGAPGVGKTALAMHWAHARRDHFPDGQLFVDLRGHSPVPALRPGDVLAQFLRALGVPPDRMPADEDEAVATYRTLLADKRMLIVLDNARDPEQVRPLIPGAQGCGVVITSRTRMAGLVVSDGARQLALDVLGPDDALRLLAHTAGAERVAAEEEAARALVQLCGGLPLAIRIAAANLHARNTGIAVYCTELAGDDLLSRLRVEGDRHATVKAAFDLSHRALPEPARRMFRLLSLMPGADVTVHGAAALADTTSAESALLMHRLTDAHLVQERSPGRFGLHDLLRSYARELVVGDEVHGARERLFEWYLRHAEAAARLLDPTRPAAGPGPAAATLVPDRAQAAAWLDAERDSLVGAVLHAAHSGFPTVAWRLAESLHGYLSRGMYTIQRLRVATAGLAAAVTDGRLRAQATAQLQRADCHWTLGNNALAVTLFGKALDLAGRAEWPAGQAMALRRIGAAHQENGSMRLASDYLSRARELTERAGGAGTADDLTDLGLICWKLGRLPEAADHFTRAARLYRDLGSVRGEAIAHTNLGIAHRAMGRSREAIRVAGAALAVHEATGNRTSETVALSCLSRAHSDLGDHRTGHRLAETALATARALGNRRLEANAAFVLAIALERAERLPEAADSYRQALHLAEVVDDRFPQVSALVGLATVQRRLGERQFALLTAQQALGLARESEFRLLEACALDVLAHVRVLLGDPRTGADLAAEALALHRETGHRPGEAHSHHVLGHAHAALGAPEEALAHRRAAERIGEETGTGVVL
ncbi:BTAD domain-containing putative transcriptional regulator [Kitasatospora sp. NPDC059722]|uniref:BTAD domain-containing putative transcriptional regulator n=1 Tax=Kitasatospora sp. NPDC059722 TaxID=3346925 RepID=UPI00367CEDB9